MLQECSSWTSRNSEVQIFLSDTKQKHVSWKICKVRKVFGCVAGAYYFLMSSELRFIKWVSFFEQNCHVKWVIFFCHFLLTLRLFARKSEIKKPWYWLEHVDEYKKVVCPKYLQKKNSRYEILNHLHFGSNFVFWRTA